MLSVEKFKSNFPLNVEIPDLLLRLLDYQNQTEDWYSGYFELTGYGRLKKLQTEENRKFREWLQTELSIETNVDADKIITAARAAHPNLDEWFTSWQEKHFGK